MPGLFGAIKLRETSEQPPFSTHDLMQEMARRLSHTGEEVVDLWIDEIEGMAIGRVRNPTLSSPAWQPRENTNGKPALLMDGFVHSQFEKDWDVIKGRPNSAQGLAKNMNGSFTFACISPGSSRPFELVADRRGSRPVFYLEHHGFLYFAPEVKALLAVDGIDLGLDYGAIGIFLGSGFVLSDQTFFASIRRLEGGQALVVENNEVGIATYYQFQMGKGLADTSSVLDLEQTLAREIRSSVERNYQSKPNELVFLSGGVDSRAIVASACEIARQNSTRVQAISWYAEDRGSRSDLGVARSLAEAFDLDLRIELRSIENFANETLNLCYLLDGMSDIASFHANETEIIRRVANTGFNRVLRGDECFGWRRHAKTIADGLLEIELRSLGQIPALQEFFNSEPRNRLVEDSDQQLGALVSEASGRHPDDVKDEAYFKHRLQRYLGSSEYFKTIFVEHRNPLLDHRLLDLVPNIPRSERRDKSLYRRAVRAAFPEFWSVPISSKGNLENFVLLIGAESAVRQALEIAVGDLDSGIWNIFNREAVASNLESLGVPTPQTRTDPGAAITQLLKSGLKTVPILGERIRGRYRRQVVRQDEFFLRFLVLKNWVDLFVDRRGTPEDLAARIEIIAEAKREP